MNLIILGPIAYFTCPIYAKDSWLLLAAAIAAFSGELPDFDIILMKIGPWVHRDIFWHSCFIPIFSPILVIFFPEEIVLYSIGLFSIGYGAHLLFDFFPKMELRGFGLIHVWSDAKSESWSLRWLAIGFLLSVILGAVIITLIVLL